MSYASLESLVTRLNDVYAARGSLDCMLTVGTTIDAQTTVAVWNRNEPYTIDAPINLKWLKGSTMYVRTSRSPSGGRKNTWAEISTVEKALEPQRWDKAKPAGWDLLQHSTNIDDPHNTRGEFEGGTLNAALKLWVDQPTGPEYAASQKFVEDKLADFTPATRFEYTANAAAIEHVIAHGKNTTTPCVSVYVEKEIAITEVEIIDANTIIVRFPFPELCEVGVL
jgi:hypothetical protein